MSFEGKINFNGKEYNSLNDIPDEFKVMFRDANNNGIPDFVEGLLNAGQKESVKPLTANFNSYFYNGKQYSSIDQLPPEAKDLVSRSLEKLERSGMGIMMPKSEINNTDNQNAEYIMNNPNDLKKEAQQELQPNFKFRLIMTGILFVLAVIYIIWLLKII